MLDRLRLARRNARERGGLADLINDCHQLLSERGEANGLMIARRVIDRFNKLPDSATREFFSCLTNDFGPDPDEMLRLARRYAQSHSPIDLVPLTRCAQAPRLELLRRINRAPEGAAEIVKMRAKLLRHLGSEPDLVALDADFEQLLASWFSPGFLRLEQVDWQSSAELLEKLIQYEAVHEIDGWTDLRRRLAPDRRCYAFFHPTLADEPLIFVEVALLREMPDAIAPLLDRRGKPNDDVDSYRVATFYSISNCQPGLRGVALGNFLVKQVVLQLKQEFPKLRTFCTLSPIPGFATWLRSVGSIASDQLKPDQIQGLNESLRMLRNAYEEDLSGLSRSAEREPTAVDTALPSRASGPPQPTAVVRSESVISGNSQLLTLPEQRRRHDDSSDVKTDREKNSSAALSALGVIRGLRRTTSDNKLGVHELALRRLCAFYLCQSAPHRERTTDPVAKFHLNNGARLERINLNADRSEKGRSQSFQLMVNYCYDLKNIEENHQQFVSDTVVASRVVRSLL